MSFLHKLNDVEDKRAWCEYGAVAERDFVHRTLPSLGVVGFVNPAKIADKYTHDLFLQVQSDVKTVRTPLFKSLQLYDIDPQYAVTINVKDGQRYYDKYPNIVVVFDVQWLPENCSKVIGGVEYMVEPMKTVRAGFLSDVWKAIEADGVKTIEYLRRVNDTNGNAKQSYVFDVRRLHALEN